MIGLLRHSCIWALIMVVAVSASTQPLAKQNFQARQGPGPDDATTTTPIGLPAGTPILSFDVIPSGGTTCQSGTATWKYQGPENIQMNLVVTNDGAVPGGNSDTSTGPVHSYTDGPDQGRRRRRDTPLHVDPTITETITTMDPNSSKFVWDKINVPEGSYMLIANFTAFNRLFKSGSFFIANGTDVSCLLSTPPTTTSGTASTTPPPTNPSTSDTGGTVTSPSSPSPSDTSNPGQVGAVSSGHVNKGAIAGGIVGGLAVLAFLFAAFLFFRCSPGVRRRDPYSGKWGNISSYDSKASRSGFGAGARNGNASGSGFGAPLGLGINLAEPKSSTRSKSSKHKNHSESTGAIMALSSSSAHGHSGLGGAGDSDHYLGFGDSEEKINSDMSHDLLSAPIVSYDPSPGVGGNTARNSSQSTASTFAYPYSYSQRPQSQSAKHSSGLGGISPSPQTFPESISNSRRTSSQSQFQTAPTSYHPSDVSLSGVVFSSASGVGPAGGNDSDTSIATPAATSFPPVPETPPPVVAVTPTTPTATRKTPRKPVPKYSPTRTQHPELDVPNDIQPGEAQKQMHYLIPDPVPPQRN